jgi:hypothetical protein
MRALLLCLLLVAIPAGATSATKAEIREARTYAAQCFIARFFGRSCYLIP